MKRPKNLPIRQLLTVLFRGVYGRVHKPGTIISDLLSDYEHVHKAHLGLDPGTYIGGKGARNPTNVKPWFRWNDLNLAWIGSLLVNMGQWSPNRAVSHGTMIPILFPSRSCYVFYLFPRRITLDYSFYFRLASPPNVHYSPPMRLGLMGTVSTKIYSPYI